MRLPKQTFYESWREFAKAWDKLLAPIHRLVEDHPERVYLIALALWCSVALLIIVDLVTA